MSVAGNSSGGVASLTQRLFGCRVFTWTLVIILAATMAAQSVASLPSLPLKINSGNRYLEDQNGVPFFVMGDAAWSITTQVTYAQANQYLTDRAARGFNSILVNLLEKKYADHAPNNIYNVPPFTGAVFATPNEPYFALVDSVLTRANQLGIVVFLSSLYLGWACGDEGWCTDVQSSSVTVMKSWGVYLGNRYKNYPNIIWVFGGDTDPSTVRAKVDSVVAGIKSADTVFPSRQVTGHATYGQIATYFPESWLTLNGTYTWTPSTLISLNDAAYDHVPTMPYYLMEAYYENENSVTTQGLRAQAYWTILRGGMGHIFGNSPIWQFGSATFGGVARDWVAALGSPGSVSMTYFRNLFASMKWYKLVPDRTGAVLTAGAMTGMSQATVAYTSDSTTIVGYLPTQRTVTISPAKLKGGSIEIRWYNPSTGLYTNSGSATKVSRDYTPPASGDWVLVISSVCCTGMTGDVDCSADGIIDIGDITALIDYMYISLRPLCCEAAANVDGSSDGGVDIADLTRLLDYMYISFTLPANCL